jgi:transcriptional regulator with XRE-family HTH domain
MHPAKIQKALKKKKITQKALAAELGVSAMFISQLVDKTRVSDRCMKHIAVRLRKKHTEVFPEYYLAPPKRSTSKVDSGYKR